MKNTQETFDETKKEQTPQCLRKWNWGAFALPVIWHVFNRAWWAMILEVLVFAIPIEQPSVKWILNLAIMVYMGWQGNRIAWHWTKNQMSTADFDERQRNWDKAGIIATIVLFVGLAVAVPLLRVVFLLAAVALVVLFFCSQPKPMKTDSGKQFTEYIVGQYGEEAKPKVSYNSYANRYQYEPTPYCYIYFWPDGKMQAEVDSLCTDTVVDSKTVEQSTLDGWNAELAKMFDGQLGVKPLVHIQGPRPIILCDIVQNVDTKDLVNKCVQFFKSHLEK